MSFERPPDDACAPYRDELTEFALGTLTGRRRSAIVSHLATCDICRERVTSLAELSDALLVLAPALEPPLGFEQRLLTRYGESAERPRRRSYSRVVSILAAALLLVVLAVAVGSGVRGGAPRSASSTPPATAALTSQGRVLGHVFLTRGTPSWLSMTIDDPHWSGTAWCSVRLNNGHVESLGRFSVLHGVGAWSALVHAGTARVVSATVTDEYGRVLASATLSA